MPEADAPAIALEEVGFAFPGAERPLLEGLSLRVERGETAAVLGPSGIGKSTLLNLVAGLAVPDAGRVVALETEVSALPEPQAARWRRKNLGFVFQQFHLLPHLTVAENTALPLALNGLEWSDGVVARLLDRLGLAGLADSYPRHLSSGQAQRTAIARALIHRPALVLADEPTGSLDEETAETVMEYLTGVAGEAGATTLLVTHAPEVAGRAHCRYRLAGHRLHREG